MGRRISSQMATTVLGAAVLLVALLPLIAAATPTITIDTDREVYVAGDTLEVSLSAQNHGTPISVNVYIGLILPDGSIFIYGQHGWTDRFECWIPNIYIPSPFDFGPMTILALEVPDGILGDFQFAAGLTNASTPEFIGEISFAPFRIESAHPAPTAYIDLIWPSPATQGEDTIQFAGHGEDRDGWIEAHEWSSDLDGVLSTDEDFSIEAADLTVGTHTISYKVQDNDGAWSAPVTEGLTIELGNDRFVNVQMGDNSNTGSYDAPFKTITHALTVVEASETAPARIHVAAGTYSASTNAEVFPLNMRSWVSLRGENPESTVLDAEDAAYHVIYCDGVSNLTIEDFTITGGHADGPVLEHYGGGVHCCQSSPSILNNIITGNDAYGGGAIYCHDGSPAVISGNTITNNSASLGGGISGFNSSPTITSNTVSDNIGSGIYCDAETTVTDNTISGNEATGFRGGAIHCTGERSPDGMPVIQGNDIYDNSASYGGGIYCSYGSPTIKDNVITSNSSIGAFNGHGGGIHLTEADALVSNNIIVGNSSAAAAGGIYCGDCAPTLCFNTIVSNQAAEDGDGISCNDSLPVINDCIIWDNGDDLYDCSATYCCIEDMDGGTGNIHSNPIFVTGPLGDYYLDPLSLSINAGSKLAITAGLSDRTTQTDGTPDTGTVDMGYHYPIPAKR